MKKLMKKLMHKWLGFVAKKKLKNGEGTYVLLDLVHYKNNFLGENVGREKFECVFKDLYDEVRQEVFDEYFVLDDEYMEYFEWTEYEKKMLEYLEREKVEVLLSLTSESEAFMSSEIGYECVMFTMDNISPKFDPDERTIALAHEIGHFIDYKFNHNRSTLSFEEFTKEDDIIPEVIAWFYAEELLKMMDFKEWEKFEYHRTRGLLSYTLGSQDMLDEYEYAFIKWKNQEKKRQGLTFS